VSLTVGLYGSIASAHIDAVGYESCRITWNNAQWRPFKVTQGHWCWYRSNLPVCDFYVIKNGALDQYDKV